MLNFLKSLIAKNNITDVTLHTSSSSPNSIFVCYDSKYARLSKAKIIFTSDPSCPKLGSLETGIYFCENLDLLIDTLVDILYPNMPQNICAVTGTNGKSSVVSYYKQILDSLGIKAASIGTIGIDPNLEIQTNMTTNNFCTNRKIMHNLKELGIDHVAMEASSHGIKQNRLKSLNIKYGAFTSFSHDHLDYHESIEEYFAIKQKLFQGIVSDVGISHYDLKIENHTCHLEKISKIDVLKKTIDKSHLAFIFDGRRYSFFTTLIANYQFENLLIAAYLAYYSTKISMEDIVSVLDKVKSPKGRLERVYGNIFVDYAHTPDGLLCTLNELRSFMFQNQKLWLIFGCGGERDKLKRPKMGAIAHQHADKIIVTDDNPRSENPSEIRSQILSQIPSKSLEIGNREEAILLAMQNMQKNDVLLIAGKGHEEYQIINNQNTTFSDQNTVIKYIQFLKH